ncbi:hypothetical protein [Carboxylicivirga caseinilyticus]|uniref:hypothetical protein n=1 Tax=Carboxylicivirga caseinilyticus TaxID=3417572 RepID=UPI003D34E66C|nr:hypothetical protein [Marinilabiliaceae bacterium A049]
MEDETVNEKVLPINIDGIKIETCFNSADIYGVADELRSLGFEVKPMGLPVTQRLKEGCEQLNF